MGLTSRGTFSILVGMLLTLALLSPAFARSGFTGEHRVVRSAAVQRKPPEEPGVFEGIPIGGFITGLVMAAAIGAGGGLIYAGIMGYRRR